MPNFDKTGPVGKGEATGRGFGSCVENQQIKFNGRGRRCCEERGGLFQKRNEEISLDDQEKILEKRLEGVRTAKRNLNAKDA
jgi:hypothetical protein